MGTGQHSDEERAELAQFIDHLFEMSRHKTWVSFAGGAGVHWAQISDWHTGKVVPEGWNLYRLIREAARARAARADVTTDQVAATAVAAAPPAQQAILDRLRSLEESVDLTRRLVAESLGLQDRARELEAELQRLRADQPPAAADGWRAL